MSHQKGDIEVGKRMVEELYRLFPDKTDKFIALKMARERKMVYEWKNGTTPSSLMLARLHYLGGDVRYVLTGKRYALVDAMVLRGGRMRWNGNRFEEES